MNKKLVSLSILFLLLFSIVPINFVWAASPPIPFTEDFEDWNVNEWDVTATVSSTFINSTEQANEGVVSGKLYQAAAGGGIVDIEIDVSTWFDNNAYSWTHTFYLYVGTNTISESKRHRIWALKNDGAVGFFMGSLIDDGSGNTILSYYDMNLIGAWVNGSITLSDSTWYKIAVDYNSQTAGYLKVWVDGVLDFSSVGEIGEDPDAWMFGAFSIDAGTPAITIYVDDSDFFFSKGGYDPYEVSLTTTDLEDFQGEAPFVFVDWKYYEFVPDVPDGVLNSADIDFLFMQFTIPTIEGMVAVAPYYDNQSDVWAVITNSSDPTRYGDYVLIQDGSVSGSSFTFKLWFEDTCLDVWDALDCVDVSIGWNETDGWAEPWHVFSDEFRVYNDGGFVANTGIVGNAGVLPGGRDVSMFGYNDSNVYKELAWRDAVHVKVQPTVYFRAGYSDFYMYFEFNYVMDDGVRRPGLQLVLSPDFVAYSGVFASNIWINMTCNWYYNNGLIKEDSLYMFYHGSVSNIGDAGNFLFYVDLWFDNQNASQLIGGRVNAFEYPVHDSADVWFRWLSSNWGIKDDVKKQSECFTALLRSDNSTFSVEEIKFVLYKQILNVPGVSGSDQFVAISDYGIFDITMAQQLPMRGISTPPWDETSMPGVGNHGVFGAIFSLFSGIGGWLSENVLFGGLNLWGTFVAFLDTIAGWLGAPGFFSWLFSEIANGLTYLYDAAGYAVDMLSGVFILFGELLGVFVTMVGDLIVGFVDFLTIFTDMMAGGYGAGVNVWEDLGISTWITIGMIFYPLYLVYLWEKEGMDAVFAQLSMIFGLLIGIYHLLEGVILGVVNLVTSLIESIPVAE